MFSKNYSFIISMHAPVCHISMHAPMCHISQILVCHISFRKIFYFENILVTINSYFGDIWKYIWYPIYFKIMPPVSFVIYVGGVDCGIESGDWPRAHPLFILPRTYRSTQPLFSLSPRAQCHKSHSLESFYVMTTFNAPLYYIGNAMHPFFHFL